MGTGKHTLYRMVKNSFNGTKPSWLALVLGQCYWKDKPKNVIGW